MATSDGAFMEPRGCNRWQAVANAAGRTGRKQAKTVAVGCDRLPRGRMVSRASAVGCHPLREVPSLRRRGSMILWFWPGLSLAAAVRARALVATAAGACLADHGSILVGCGPSSELV